MPKKPVVVTEGRLRFAVASTITVRAATPRGTYNLFKVAFGMDGSIYVPFPYLETKCGILTEADPVSEPDPKTLQLRRNGVVVEYDVKFAHHTSGRVHFSKTGSPEGELLPRRQSFPLNGPIGKLFVFNAFLVDRFERQTRGGRARELGLALAFPTHPTSIQVTAEWRRKKDIEANTTPGRSVIGPQVVAEERATGRTTRCVLLGQPAGSPLQEHVIMLTAHEVPLPSGVDSATAVFWGGWDAHENKTPETARMLAFMYPIRGEPSGKDGD